VKTAAGHYFRTSRLNTRMMNFNQKKIVCNRHCNNYKDEMNQEPMMMDEPFLEFDDANTFDNDEDYFRSLSSLAASSITWDAGDYEDTYTFPNSSDHRFLPFLSPTLEQESLHDKVPTMISRRVDRFESGLSEMPARRFSSLKPLSKPVRQRSNEERPLRGISSSSPLRRVVVDSQQAIPSMVQPTPRRRLTQDSVPYQQSSLRASMPLIRTSKDRVPDQIPSSMPLIMPSRRLSQGVPDQIPSSMALIMPSRRLSQEYMPENFESMPRIWSSDSILPPCQPQRRASVIPIDSLSPAAYIEYFVYL
jgi:hypothetical protein